MTNANQISMEIVTDPQEIASAQQRQASFERNLAWFQAHALEIYRTHRGKCVCVAGQQLFVSDSATEAIAMAQAAHPQDEGRFTRIIPREKLDRIYAAQGTLASVR